MINTIVHEGFPFYHQFKLWKNLLNSGYSTLRGMHLPIQIEPRYYRKMMIENLRSALKSRNNQKQFHFYLQQSVLATNLWLKSNPQEAKLFTDVIEASAEYVGSKSEALAYLGCDTSEDQIISYILKKPRKEKALRLDQESYRIGLFAGLALDVLKAEDWKMKTESMQLSYDLIRAKVDLTIEFIDNQEIKQEIDLLHSDLKKRVDRELSPYLKAIKNKKISIFSTSKKYKSSNFDPEFFVYNDPKLGKLSFKKLKSTMSFHEINRDNFIQISTEEIYTSIIKQNPCGADRRNFFISLKKPKFSRVSDGWRYKNGDFEIKVNKVSQALMNGYHFYCLE